MKIAKSQLRKIIKEEVEMRLIEYYVEKEIEILFEDSEDPEVQKAREEYRRLSRQGKKIPAALALFLGIGFGGLKYATDQHADIKGANIDAEITQNMEKAASDEAQLDKFSDQLNNQYAFRWGKGNNAVVYAPGSKGKITVLPASYSIAVKALQDKKMNAERIAQGLRPFERYGEIDLDNLRDNERGYEGDFEQNIDNFFKTHKGNFVNAMNVVSAHDELNVVPGSGTENMIVMVHPDKISGDYYLPELGMTAADFYNSQYGSFMGSGEMAALEQPDEEMVITPDDGPQLNPELVRKTKERVDDLRESAFASKDYKNRKKVLA